MKIGLISDIHADLTSLKRAVALLREKGADIILCAGDLVDGETEGNATAQYIKAQKIPTVQGNHDHAMLEAAAYSEEWIKSWDERVFGPPPWANHDDNLNNDTVAFLRTLPLTLRFTWDDKRLLLAHASPWDQATYIYPNGRREYYDRISAEADADIVILGHTHMPMAVRAKDTWVLNPGSVGGNRHEPYNATCGLIDLVEMRYRVLDIRRKCPVIYARTHFN